MKITYVTTYNAKNVKNWSGLGAYISQALKDSSTSLRYVGPLQEEVDLLSRAKRVLYKRVSRKAYLLDRDPRVLKKYARQITSHLNNNSDLVFSPGTVPIAYLECQNPIVFWTDATFGSMVDFYPEFSNLCRESIDHGNQMERSALSQCQLAIYSSDWAAESAIKLYKVNPAKIKVVPFGANLQCDRNLNDIKSLVAARPTTSCNLLLLGGNWERKGGNVALQVAKTLNEMGLQTKLLIVGCIPPITEPVPDFVRVIPFIDKNKVEGINQINQLIAKSHFMILPSIADCTPVVFSEANSFGVPCLSTDVGGITTIIRENINGKTFSRDAAISEYCDYVNNIFSDYKQYQSLALSSFHEYQCRLNWEAAGQTVRNLLREL